MKIAEKKDLDLEKRIEQLEHQISELTTRLNALEATK